MTTDTERWRRIRALVETAMELSGAERARWIDGACGGDEALRRDVEELLAHDREDDAPDARLPSWSGELGDLRSLAEAFDAAESRAARDEIRRIGAYLLVREIGSGGMGKVFLAERDDAQYRKRVAIKVIKRGMDSDDILRRFKNERQILADLEHENIARLLDGGSTDGGQPYLVLEYVDGVPIDRYCDEHRATVRERVELFLAVCSAVHYAHERHAVHRDIKPSNILVTSAGVPKLLDFGIAKVFGAEDGELAQLTSTIERRLTPAYASPEQIRGEAITPASDVFSLGVVLYELLTGEKPFAAHDRTAESAPYERPEKPSTVAATARPATCDARRADSSVLRRSLAGDLDTIVLKAMHGDAERRYPSVGALADDLRRHLKGLPVSARPDSFSYRAAKFVKRNTLLVGATITILLALAVGFATSTVLYFRAVDAQEKFKEKSVLAESRLHDAEIARAAERVQRELAERRFADVRKLATTFIFDVHSAIEPLQGSLPARQLIVKTCTEFLERLASEKRDDSALQLDLARAWYRISMIQSSFAPSLGQTAAALQTTERALAISHDLVRDDPRNGEILGLLNDIRLRKAEILIFLHRLPEARAMCGEIAVDVEQLAADRPGARSFEFQALSAHTRLGGVLDQMGEFEASLEQYRRGAAIGTKLAQDWSGDDSMQAAMAAMLQQLGRSLAKCGHFEESVSTQLRALEVFQWLAERNPTRAGWRREIGASRNALANAYADQGCFAEARVEARTSFEIMTSLSRGDGTNAAGLADSGGVCIQCAGLALIAREFEDAFKYACTASRYFEDLVQVDPDNLDMHHHLAVAYGHMGTALVESQRVAEGLRSYALAHGELEALAAEEPSDAAVQVDLHFCCAKMGHAYALQAEALEDDPDARADALRSAHEGLERGVEGLRRMRMQGSIAKGGDVRIEEFERDLERCVEKLARLGEVRPAK